MSTTQRPESGNSSDHPAHVCWSQDQKTSQTLQSQAVFNQQSLLYQFKL